MTSKLARVNGPRKSAFYTVQMLSHHGTWQATEWVPQKLRGRAAEAIVYYHRAVLAHPDYRYRFVQIWSDGHVTVLKESS